MKNILFTLITSLVVMHFANAQTVVTGTVTASDSGGGLPGATVQELGTTNGDITDIDGKFSITVGDNATLEISFLGYTTQEIVVGNQTVLDVELLADAVALDGVVITAFGIEKSKRSLGFSQTKIGGDELVQAKEVNLISQLSGKVAGLNITKPNSGVAGSTIVEIRGQATLTGNDSPLIVIDGVPINNTQYSSNEIGESTIGQFGGTDFGDAFTSINPDDIESINVLKGASAGTLYGERGARGVIVITTKKGSQDLTIEYNGNITADMPTNVPSFYQRQYGQGRRGQKPTSVIDALNQTGSWGSLLDGSDFTFYDGVVRPYVAAPENDILNYLRTGYTINNNFSVSGGNEVITSRFSVSQLKNEGNVPESEYTRYTINSLTSMNFKDKLTLEIKANFIEEDAKNRSGVGAAGTNPGTSFTFLPPNISAEILRGTIRDPNNEDRTSNAIPWFNSAQVLNPYWAPFENIQEDNKRRLIGYFLAKYQFVDQLSLQVRYARDWTRVNDFYVDEQGTEYVRVGQMSTSTSEYNDNTFDAILNFNDQITEALNVNVNLGGVQNPRNSVVNRIGGREFISSGVYHVSNLVDKNPPNPTIRARQTNALYATALFNYKNFLFLDGSVRQDWYSTLTNPLDKTLSDNTSLYGAGALSFILSDVVKLPTWFTYAKVRGSYGTSGAGTPISGVLNPSYSFDPFIYDGKDRNLPAARIDGQLYANPFLTPTLTKAIELGVDAKFLQNRLNVGLTYYKENTTRQLITVPIPSFTGYARTLTNVGEVENKGFELQLSARPIQNAKFSWNVSFNIARNFNELVSLRDGSDSFFNDEVATVLQRDENGAVIHGPTGVPLVSTQAQTLGNFTPDFSGGLTNTFKYKDLSLDVVLDFKQGGELWSGSNAAALANGKHNRTLPGRDNPFFQIIGEGVNEAGEENSVFAFLDQYYGGLALATETSIFDASFVKVRQVALSYNLPSSFLSKFSIKSARLSVTGRNLFIISSGLSELGIDPEALYNTNNSGFEYATLPTNRSVGVNLFIKF